MSCSSCYKRYADVGPYIPFVLECEHSICYFCIIRNRAYQCPTCKLVVVPNSPKMNIVFMHILRRQNLAAECVKCKKSFSKSCAQICMTCANETEPNWIERGKADEKCSSFWMCRDCLLWHQFEFHDVKNVTEIEDMIDMAELELDKNIGEDDWVAVNWMEDMGYKSKRTIPQIPPPFLEFSDPNDANILKKELFRLVVNTIDCFQPNSITMDEAVAKCFDAVDNEHFGEPTMRTVFKMFAYCCVEEPKALGKQRYFGKVLLYCIAHEEHREDILQGLTDFAEWAVVRYRRNGGMQWTKFANLLGGAINVNYNYDPDAYPAKLETFKKTIDLIEKALPQVEFTKQICRFYPNRRVCR